MDIRRILRFNRYWHSLPLTPLDQMEFDLDPDCSNYEEQGILWLRPKKNYPFYLRKSVQVFHRKQTVPKYIVESTCGADPTGHIVAVAILANSDAAGFFKRRIWFVNSYDAFHGYRPLRHPDGTVGWYDDRNGPCEAVLPQFITPNVPDQDGFNEGDRSTLRPWDGCQPKMWERD